MISATSRKLVSPKLQISISFIKRPGSVGRSFDKTILSMSGVFCCDFSANITLLYSRLDIRWLVIVSGFDTKDALNDHTPRPLGCARAVRGKGNPCTAPIRASVYPDPP